MRENTLRTRLRDGIACKGVWLALPSPATARQLARLPADFLVVDAEHGPMGAETMIAMVFAIADGGGVPVVRIAESTAENVKRALDAGAEAVIAPSIETVAQTEALVAAAKFPPLGKRSFGSAWAPLAFGTTMPGYLTVANEQTLVFAQIETAAGLAAVDEIAAVPGLDGLFVGPVDLCISLGLLPPAPEHPALAEPLAAVLAAAKRNGLPAGIFCSSARAALARVDAGFRFVNVASDVASLLREVRAQLDEADLQDHS